MPLDLRDQGSVTATVPHSPAAVVAADPWDAPYFGGRVYFQYPRFHTAAVAAAAYQPPAEVALASPPEPAQPAGASTQLANHAAPPLPASAPAELPAPARRGWLRRLLRQG